MTANAQNDADRALEQAIAAYREANYTRAEALCRKLLSEHPENIAGMQVLAAVAGQLGIPRRGVELVHKIIELQPQNADAHIQLAKLLSQEGKDREALAALEAAIELAPDSAAAHNDLGLLHLNAGNASDALASFERAIAIEPGMAIAHFNRGLVLERQELSMDAVAAYRKAVTVDEQFSEAYAKLGYLLLINNERSEASEMFAHAVASKPDSGVAWMCRARLLLEEGKAAEAEKAARQAIEREPRNSDAHALLGAVLMELGQFDDAAAASDLAIALNRQQFTAYHALTCAKKLTQCDRPLVAQMEWVLAEGDLNEQGRTDISFALGKAYDDYGEYETAIGHFDEGNRLKHRHTSSNHETYAAAVDRQIAAFDETFFARNAVLGSNWDVPVFILGMPRSGTTLVEQIVSSHPDVAAGGELAFWCERASGFRMDRNRRVDPSWIGPAIRDYRALLSEFGPNARRVTDKMPLNFNVIGLIRAAFPRARIIHCKRHPADTCLSIYFQNFSRRVDFAYDRSDLVSFYRQYERLMAHWRSVLPPQSLLEIQYDELVQTPEPVTRSMIAFCGLEWNDACLHHENNLRPVRTASLWQARQPVYRTSIARWQKYRPWLGELEALLTEREKDTTAPHPTAMRTPQAIPAE